MSVLTGANVVMHWRRVHLHVLGLRCPIGACVLRSARRGWAADACPPLAVFYKQPGFDMTNWHSDVSGARGQLNRGCPLLRLHMQILCSCHFNTRAHAHASSAALLLKQAHCQRLRSRQRRAPPPPPTAAPLRSCA